MKQHHTRRRDIVRGCMGTDRTMTFEQAEVVEETWHWLKGYRGVHDGLILAR